MPDWVRKLLHAMTNSQTSPVIYSYPPLRTPYFVYLRSHCLRNVYEYQFEWLSTPLPNLNFGEVGLVNTTCSLCIYNVLFNAKSLGWDWNKQWLHCFYLVSPGIAQIKETRGSDSWISLNISTKSFILSKKY